MPMSWEEFVELQALMQPGTDDPDPLDRGERTGQPLDEPAPCKDCGQPPRRRLITGRCEPCYKRRRRETTR